MDPPRERLDCMSANPYENDCKVGNLSRPRLISTRFNDYTVKSVVI